MSFKNFLKIVLLCRNGLISTSDIGLLSYILAPALFQKDDSEEKFQSAACETQWPANAISANKLQRYHDVPLSKHYFYKFKNEKTNTTEYVTITNQGYLETVNGKIVSEKLLRESQVWTFLE